MALKKTKKNVSTNNKKSTIKKIALDCGFEITR